MDRTLKFSDEDWLYLNQLAALNGHTIEKFIMFLVGEFQNPENEARGKPKNDTKVFNEEAKKILTFLNQKTQKNFKMVDSNLDPIVARLREGATSDECRMIVALKARAWNSDVKMRDFLRPITLFGKQKFWTYHGELKK